MLQVALGRNQLCADFGKFARDRPFRKVASKLAEIADVTDVVANSVLLHVVPAYMLAGKFLDELNALEHGSAVLPAAAQIVDFSRPGIPDEGLERGDHINAVNLIPHLFPFVTVYRIDIARNRDAHQIRKKAVQLHARVSGTCQAASSEDPHLQTEVPAIFLGHDVRRRLGGAEQGMKAAIYAAGLIDSMVVFPVR